jgi:hypothetical protein
LRITTAENICGCIRRQPCVKKTGTLARKFQRLPKTNQEL